jgi:cyclopropane-fatty-acyl-phospholipid synthase
MYMAYDLCLKHRDSRGVHHAPNVFRLQLYASDLVGFTRLHIYQLNKYSAALLSLFRCQKGDVDCDNWPKLYTNFLADEKRDKELFGGLFDKYKLARNLQTTDKSLEVAEIHYDLGNDLYIAMLGSTMNYTCAYWKEDTKTLDEAQINKMDLIACKLKLKPGMTVLDIGCGFGTMAKYLCENYKVSVVGYTISKEQVTYAREQCKGLPDIEFILEDYRNAEGVFDRVYSIGFFEHVGVHNYREYFEVVHRCLKDDGIHLLHTIGLRDNRHSKTHQWVNTYIFPGGELPYPEDIFTYSSGLFMCEDLHNIGYAYSLTLRAWLKNFEANWENNLKPKYNTMVNGQFYRMWIIYLSYAIAAFETRRFNLYQVVQSKRGLQGGYVSVR